MGRHVWKRREQRDTSKMPREDDEEDDAEEDDDATGQCSESVDNGMMFCEEVLSSLKMTWGPLCLVYRGRTKTPVSSFSILGGRNSWPRYENGDFIAKLEESASFWNEGLSPAPISHFPPGSDQFSRNSCRGGNHPRFYTSAFCRWRPIAMGLYQGTPRSYSSTETTSCSVWCLKRTGERMGEQGKNAKSFLCYQEWLIARLHKPLQLGDAGENIVVIRKGIMQPVILASWLRKN